MFACLWALRPSPSLLVQYDIPNICATSIGHQPSSLNIWWTISSRAPPAFHCQYYYVSQQYEGKRSHCGASSRLSWEAKNGNISTTNWLESPRPKWRSRQTKVGHSLTHKPATWVPLSVVLRGIEILPVRFNSPGVQHKRWTNERQMEVAEVKVINFLFPHDIPWFSL